MIVSAVKPDNLANVWQHVRPFILSALEFEHGTLTEGKVFSNILSNIYILIVVVEDEIIIAAQTMQIIDEPGQRICNLVTTGGNKLDLWQDELMGAIKTIAKQNNCDYVQTRGRPGWLKKLKQNGFEPLYFIARCEL